MMRLWWGFIYRSQETEITVLTKVVEGSVKEVKLEEVVEMVLQYVIPREARKKQEQKSRKVKGRASIKSHNLLLSSQT